MEGLLGASAGEGDGGDVRASFICVKVMSHVSNTAPSKEPKTIWTLNNG